MYGAPRIRSGGLRRGAGGPGHRVLLSDGGKYGSRRRGGAHRADPRIPLRGGSADAHRREPSAVGQRVRPASRPAFGYALRCGERASGAYFGSVGRRAFGAGVAGRDDRYARRCDGRFLDRASRPGCRSGRFGRGAADADPRHGAFRPAAAGCRECLGRGVHAARRRPHGLPAAAGAHCDSALGRADGGGGGRCAAADGGYARRGLSLRAGECRPAGAGRGRDRRQALYVGRGAAPDRGPEPDLYGDAAQGSLRHRRAVERRGVGRRREHGPRTRSGRCADGG